MAAAASKRGQSSAAKSAAPQPSQLWMLDPGMVPAPAERCRVCGKAEHSEPECNAAEDILSRTGEFVHLHRQAPEAQRADWDRQGYEQAYVNVRRCYRCLLWGHDELACRTPPSRIDELRTIAPRLLQIDLRRAELPPNQTFVPPTPVDENLDELPPPLY